MVSGEALRTPAVAGQFYAGSARALREQIRPYIDLQAEKKDAIACLLPHAGYMYSGRIAGKTISRLNIKKRVLLLGPNHAGMGSACSIMTQGIWQTPLGNISIDTHTAEALLQGCRFLENDPRAHIHEHSLEVELPLLQYVRNDFSIIPIVFAQASKEVLKEIGKDIAGTLTRLRKATGVLVVASSDMTHYEEQRSAEAKDGQALEAILDLNEDLLWERVEHFGISMCGVAATIVMISAAKELGARKATLVGYETSAKTSGDESSVVGYAGVLVE